GMSFYPCARAETLIIVHGRIDESTIRPREKHLPFAFAGSFDVALSLATGAQAWLGDFPDGVHTDLADLAARLGITGADTVELLVFLFEGGLDLRDALHGDAIPSAGPLHAVALRQSHDRGEAGSVDRAGAAEGVDDKLFRQIAGAHDLAADQIRHLGIDDIVDAGGGLVYFELQRLGDLLFDGAQGLFFVQRHSAAEKIIRVDDAEGEVCIGDRDLVAAGVVADRPGVGPGAARSDQQSPGFRFHLREGAAARADGFNIDDRLQH